MLRGLNPELRFFSWQDDHEMGDVPNRLVGLIAEAGGKTSPLQTVQEWLVWDASWSCMFALSGSMKTMSRIGSGEKPYQCQLHSCVSTCAACLLT